MKKMCIAAATAVTLAAAAQQPPAGNYVSAGGWDSVRIDRDGKFKIDALGANGHTCELEGTFKGRTGRTADEPVCRVDFTRNGERWTLGVADADNEACRNYCGMRAWFAGDFWPERPACNGKPLERSRAEFMRLYRAKQFDPAAAVLEKVFAQCGEQLFQPTAQDMRNDLGLAYHHAGRDEECRRVLQPIADYYVPEPTVVTFAPADEDWGLPLVSKTRFNWKLCKGGPIPRK